MVMVSVKETVIVSEEKEIVNKYAVALHVMMSVANVMVQVLT